MEEIIISENIYDLLYRLGVTSNYTGFAHTAYALQLCMGHPERLRTVTKFVYPEVARYFNTNWKDLTSGAAGPQTPLQKAKQLPAAGHPGLQPGNAKLRSFPGGAYRQIICPWGDFSRKACSSSGGGA